MLPRAAPRGRPRRETSQSSTASSTGGAVVATPPADTTNTTAGAGAGAPGASLPAASRTRPRPASSRPAAAGAAAGAAVRRRRLQSSDGEDDEEAARSDPDDDGDEADDGGDGDGGDAHDGAGGVGSGAEDGPVAPDAVVERGGRRRPLIQRPTEITQHGIRQYVESQDGVKIFLQNCVSTVNLKVNPDLAHIATHARNVEYNPKRFSGAVLRLRDPKATCLLFRSGKMVITGAKNEDDAQLAGRKVARVLQKLGFPAKFADFMIQNMVGTGDVQFPIRLEGLAFEHGRFSSYEPELFPGLIYRMDAPKVVLLIFVSGKIVLTGSKCRADLVDAFNKIYPVLYRYRIES